MKPITFLYDTNGYQLRRIIWDFSDKVPSFTFSGSLDELVVFSDNTTVDMVVELCR